MIVRVQVSNYRCLRYVDQRIGRFTVLVGPNASGKTTFLDAIQLLGNVINLGPRAAVESRCNTPYDLIHCHEGNHFEIAIEAKIPEQLRRKLLDPYPGVRYEVSLGFTDSGEFGFLGERLELCQLTKDKPLAPGLFDSMPDIEPVYLGSRKHRNARRVLHKSHDGKDRMYSETLPNKGKGWIPTLSLGPSLSALKVIPDETRFPVALWLRDYLCQRVQRFVLNSHVIRAPSTPGQPIALTEDGSNFPWVIERFEQASPGAFKSWIRHIQTALPEIAAIRVRELPDNRKKYIEIEYSGGIRVPSWSVSDGTLRFLVLTVIAYLKEKERTYLIEEPENGIHPCAVEPVFESLSSAYDSQVLLATHSPIVLGLVDKKDILVFRRTGGETIVTSGDRHPALAEWKGEISLGMMFASGILD